MAEDDDEYPVIQHEGDQFTIDVAWTDGDDGELDFGADVTLPAEPGRPGGC